MHEIPPFSIPSFRSFVPEKLRPWIILLFVIIFQLSGGVYLAAVSEMVGSLALRQEDIMMAGYASLVGLALTFTLMFRLKFRFTSKWILLGCCVAIIIGNLICMHTQSVPVLVVTCFVLGFFRMWATFACNTQIQLWLTPVRDLSIFFCFVKNSSSSDDFKSSDEYNIQLREWEYLCADRHLCVLSYYKYFVR